MRVTKLASFAAAAGLAVAGAVVPNPASAYPSGAVVLVATPAGGSALAVPVTCLVQLGTETPASAGSTTWFGSVDCTGPVASLSGRSEWAEPVLLTSVQLGSSFSCTGCTSGYSSGTTTENPVLGATRLELDATAPAGYTWQLGNGAQRHQGSPCRGIGTGSIDCTFISAEWASPGV